MKGTKTINISKRTTSSQTQQPDTVVEESPLQILIAYGPAGNRKKETLSVTMRTPGDDHNLVTGFLYCEGIIQQATDILTIKYAGNPNDEALQGNSMIVELASSVAFDMDQQKRNFIASASCGFCGKTNADITQQGTYKPISNDLSIKASLLYQLPKLLGNAQTLFTQTGGAHAVALFNTNGELVQTGEDVGRHNAMDKLVGDMLRKKAIPLSQHIVLFSGRLSYELVQKSVAAGIPAICAIGAPTSLAIELAEDYGILVIGFLKPTGFNIYCGAHNIIDA